MQKYIVDSNLVFLRVLTLWFFISIFCKCRNHGFFKFNKLKITHMLSAKPLYHSGLALTLNTHNQLLK